MGGKLLENLMIDRILFHIHSKFKEENLRLKQCAVLVSLDVKGAFDAAWWPSILK